MIVVLLSHLMDEHGALNAESRGRASIAKKIFYDFNANYIITLGWDYRNDCRFCIGNQMKLYLEHQLQIHHQFIISETRSKDTVGDAIYCKLALDNLGIKPNDILIATSDYHLPRSLSIFRFIYGDSINITSPLSHKTSLQYRRSRELSEFDSINAFQKTFNAIQPGDFKAIYHRFLTKHPYYNGSVFLKN